VIDLLLGGSPCQGFSFAGKQLNFFDPRSKLFFDFVKAKEALRPKYFLLENVNMKREYLDIITERLGVQPTRINSADFSAQDRDRWYWTNIPFSMDWGKCPDTVEDILEDEVDDKYFINPQSAVIILEKEVQKRKIAYIGADSQSKRIYRIHGKSVSLCSGAGGMGNKTGLYALPCITPDRIEKRQNGRRFKPPHSKFYTLTAQDKHGILTNNFIRKLTPLECERLQTLPEGYTEGCSDNQRYMMIGNGWTVDVIAHILSYIPETHLQTVVGLFDGISCGQVALERAGKVYNQYYASEIDKYAIQITQKNYPHTMQLGDVTAIDWAVFLDRLEMIQKVS
jgi:DNA (cytosine-5)-methyltransferase 3A